MGGSFGDVHQQILSIEDINDNNNRSVHNNNYSKKDREINKNRENQQIFDESILSSIPPNTEKGRMDLCSRVQTKLNEMILATEYLMDSRLQHIVVLASSHLYNAQKTAWILMHI